jgi:hypothetical protein
MSQPLAIIFLTAIFANMMSVGSTGDIMPSFKFTTKREPWHDSAQKRGFSQKDHKVRAVSQLMPIITDDLRVRLRRGSPCTPNPDGYNKRLTLSEDWLNDNPAVPGGLLKSKPTWGSNRGGSSTSAFFAC